MVMTVKEAMTNIANKIRDVLGLSEKIRLTDIPSLIDTVSDVAYSNGEEDGYWMGWDAGYSDGESAGYSNGMLEGFDAGKQAEYDSFWDAYQQNGNRTSYVYAFAGQAWTDEIYNPKYPFIVISNSNGMFTLSKLTNVKQPVDIRGASGQYFNIFNTSEIVTIPKLIVSESTSFSGDFDNCRKLQNITFEGTIGRDINLQWSPLTGESVYSIIFALADYFETDDAWKYTITLSQSSWTAVNAYAEELTQKHNEETGENVTASEYIWDSYPDAQDFVENKLGWLIG